MDLPGQGFDYDNFKLFGLYKNHDILHHKLHEMFHDKISVENVQNTLIYGLSHAVFIGRTRDPLLPFATATAWEKAGRLEPRSVREGPWQFAVRQMSDKPFSDGPRKTLTINAPAWIHQGPRKAKALPSTTKVGLSRPQARRIEDCLGRQTEILQIGPWCCPEYGISSRTFSRARVDFSSTLEPKLATNSPPQEALIRLPDVLSRFPVSRSKWYAGVKAGTYPQPIKEGRRTAMWRVSDADRLILSLTTK